MRRMSRLLDYTERLQRLATDNVSEVGVDPKAFDQKTLALVRLGALIAIGGAIPSYGAHIDAAIDAGAYRRGDRRRLGWRDSDYWPALQSSPRLQSWR